MLVDLRKLLLTICMLGVLLPHNAMAKDNIEKTGDVLQFLIPTVGYGATWYLDDKEGRSSFYKSISTNIAATCIIKYAVNRKRPNGGRHSFPSGHTSVAFQGAAFIHKRYGLEYALGAYAGAAFVGYSRVYTDKHYTSDVIVGAALGIASSFYFTTEYKGCIIKPTLDDNKFGISISKIW